jgi:hypothetical protein
MRISTQYYRVSIAIYFSGYCKIITFDTSSSASRVCNAIKKASKQTK